MDSNRKREGECEGEREDEREREREGAREEELVKVRPRERDVF